MSWRRRRNDWFRHWLHDEDFDEMFMDIEEDFRRVQEQMNRFMMQMARGDFPSPEEGGPFVYGFSMKVGPDGKPEVREFGNTKFWPGQKKLEEPEMKAREPVTDLIVGKDDIAVTFEMPGVERNDIDVQITEDKVTIEAKTEGRTYKKEVGLPHEVDSEKSKATYNNGVLEVCIPMVKEKERKATKVKVG